MANNIKPGDIVRAPFTFSDLSIQKVGPALVLTLAILDDAVIAAITSNTTVRDRFDYQLVDWQEAGLDKVSVVRLTKLYTLNQSLFEHIVGHLSPRDWIEVKKLWLELLD